MRLGHPVEILACESIAKAPQKVRLRSSVSTQEVAGPRVGGMSSCLASSRSRPIMSTSLTHLAVVRAALVNNMHLASKVAMMAYAWAWATVTKCSPDPFGSC